MPSIQESIRNHQPKGTNYGNRATPHLARSAPSKTIPASALLLLSHIDEWKQFHCSLGELARKYLRDKAVSSLLDALRLRLKVSVCVWEDADGRAVEDIRALLESVKGDA